MSVELLDRIRKINKLLHNNTSNVFVFNDICHALSDAMGSNVLVMSRKGKILGMGNTDPDLVDSNWKAASVGVFIDPNLNERLLNILSTKENVHLETLGFDAEANRIYRVIVTPIAIAGERLGTFFIYRKGEEYGIDDIILAEYGTAVIGLEMVRAMDEENAEELRRKQGVRDQHDERDRDRRGQGDFRRTERHGRHPGREQDRRPRGDHPLRDRECPAQAGERRRDRIPLLRDEGDLYQDQK